MGHPQLPCAPLTRPRRSIPRERRACPRMVVLRNHGDGSTGWVLSGRSAAPTRHHGVHEADLLLRPPTSRNPSRHTRVARLAAVVGRLDFSSRGIVPHPSPPPLGPRRPHNGPTAQTVPCRSWSRMRAGVPAPRSGSRTSSTPWKMAIPSPPTLLRPRHGVGGQTSRGHAPHQRVPPCTLRWQRGDARRGMHIVNEFQLGQMGGDCSDAVNPLQGALGHSAHPREDVHLMAGPRAPWQQPVGDVSSYPAHRN